MKIKQLDVAGFRSLKNVSWKPGDLNVVIGQNGTGKSNLLSLLGLIADSAEGRLSKTIRASGGMSSIAWDGVAPQIAFRLHTITENEVTPAEDCYEVEIAAQRDLGLYYIQREFFTHKIVNPENAEAETIKIIDINNSQGFYYNDKIRIKGDETALSQLGRKYSNPSEKWVDSEFREQLLQIRSYQDLDVRRNSQIRQAPITRHDVLVEADGQNLVAVLNTLCSEDREFRDTINTGMRAAFGDVYEELVFSPAADQRVQPRVRWKTLKRAIPFADLSDGTLRFLFLLTVLTAPNPPKLIAIDEPETGLHPSMLPIIAEYAVEASRRTQVVFTTHSPQFLDAFTDTKPTTTVVRWENGETSLHALDEEELDNWLREYSLGTLFRQGDLEALA